MAATKITVRNDGSIRVEGDFEVVRPGRQGFGLAGRDKIGLCRCGHSANKPFCDGAHKKVDFQSTIQAFDFRPSRRPRPRQPLPNPSRVTLGKNLTAWRQFQPSLRRRVYLFATLPRHSPGESRSENSIVSEGYYHSETAR